MTSQTHRLDESEVLWLLERDAFGTHRESDLIGYIQLPVWADSDDDERPRWRLVLQLTGTNQGMLRFEILDDVIVGRDSDVSDAPDLDMSILDAYNLGVSRQHALLRPTANHLYLIDLGSTNGTLVSGYPIGAGRAYALAQGDQISLGRLNMAVTLLERVPGTGPGLSTDKLPAPRAKKVKRGGKATDRLTDREDKV